MNDAFVMRRDAARWLKALCVIRVGLPQASAQEKGDVKKRGHLTVNCRAVAILSDDKTTLAQHNKWKALHLRGLGIYGR